MSFISFVSRYQILTSSSFIDFFLIRDAQQIGLTLMNMDIYRIDQLCTIKGSALQYSFTILTDIKRLLSSIHVEIDNCANTATYIYISMRTKRCVSFSQYAFSLSSLNEPNITNRALWKSNISMHEIRLFNSDHTKRNFLFNKLTIFPCYIYIQTIQTFFTFRINSLNDECFKMLQYKR